METVVKVEALQKVYQLGKVTVTALNHIDLKVLAGDFLAIAGPSGSGKTTLLNLIGCLDTPTGGRIEIAGRDVAGLDANQLADIRNAGIGFVFQTFNLIPVLTAYENVEFPLLLSNCPADDRHDKIMRVLEEVGLTDQAHHKPAEMSGGQMQRVAIARAIVKSPEIILADEPTANLDSTTGSNIIELMRQLNTDKGTTFIFATHDPMVMDQAGTIVRLQDGRRVGD